MTVLSTLRTLKSEDSSSLQVTIDTVNAAKDALRRAGCKTKHWDDVFVYFAVRALDPTTRKDWETSLGGARERPTYQKLRDFVQGWIRALQLSEQSRVLEQTSGPSRGGRTETTTMSARQRVRTLTNVIGSGSDRGEPLAQDAQCPWHERHYAARCPVFMNTDQSRQRTLTAQLSLCFNCLRPGHRVTDCPSQTRCSQCHGKHHSLLHESRKRRIGPGSGSASQLKRPRTDEETPRGAKVGSSTTSGTTS